MIEVDTGSVTRTVLRNGLTVLVKRDMSAPVVAIVTYVKAGYFDETDDRIGVAHVLEHMYFKGTPTRGVGAIAKETMSSGGYLNAATIYDHTSYYTVLPAARVAEGLAIQADAYARSVIDAGELAKELEVIIQESQRKADSPSAVATETLYELLHDRHRMRRWRIGRPEALRGFTRELLLDFYHTFYRPSNTILVVVGAVEPDEVLRLVEAQYGGVADGAVPHDRGLVEVAPPGRRYREWAGDIGQTQLLFGWRTPGTHHPDTPLLDIAATALGAGRASRLYRAVRDVQLASTVSAYNYTPTDLGVFVVHAETRPERTVDAARAIWGQLVDARIEPVEVERAQRLFEAQWARRTESMEGQANHLAEWEALGGWALGDEYLARIQGASAADVSDAMRRHLDPAQTAALVYRPEGTPAVGLDGVAFMAEGAIAPPVRPRGDEVRVVGGAATFEREVAGVHVYRTTGGVPILVRRRAGAAITHLGVTTLGGPRDEPSGVAGISTLMARTAVKGTTTRSATEIAVDAEFLGGSVGSSVGSEQVGWSLSVPVARTGAALALLADVVQRPTFPEDALETERTVALADLVALRDDMYRYPVRLATEAAFAGHSYGLGTLGSDASLRAITRDAVAEWHVRQVLRGPMVIGIVGDVDPDVVADAAAVAFGDVEAGVPAVVVPPVWTVGERVEAREKAQTALALAFPGPARGDADREAVHLIATMASGLGGRFFDELRDKRSLAYTVHAFGSERAQAGMFIAYIATSPAREAEARAGLLAEFAKLRDAPVGADELTRAQTYAVGAHAIRQQSGGTVLAEMIDAWLFGAGLHELAEHDTRVWAVTRPLVQAAAQRYFDPEQVVEGVVRGVIAGMPNGAPAPR
ncbi:MAG TPA: pitrilysin family protein [Gemmatimonadaceae bacterium]|nr:pitrilysin family protein [Gemmatimonadaceae bacterium]